MFDALFLIRRWKMSRQEREPMSGNPPVSGTETQTRSRVISETRESETGRNPSHGKKCGP
jgi:hypothetical protein